LRTHNAARNFSHQIAAWHEPAADESKADHQSENVANVRAKLLFDPRQYPAARF